MPQHHIKEHGTAAREATEQRKRHWLPMLLCCLPMLAVLALIILGVWGSR